jgi:hypothetical protein
VTIFHSKPIFWRVEEEEEEAVGAIMPAITVLPVQLTYVTHPDSTVFCISLYFKEVEN